MSQSGQKRKKPQNPTGSDKKRVVDYGDGRRIVSKKTAPPATSLAPVEPAAPAAPVAPVAQEEFRAAVDEVIPNILALNLNIPPGGFNFDEVGGKIRKRSKSKKKTRRTKNKKKHTKKKKRQNNKSKKSRYTKPRH